MKASHILPVGRWCPPSTQYEDNSSWIGRGCLLALWLRQPASCSLATLGIRCTSYQYAWHRTGHNSFCRKLCTPPRRHLPLPDTTTGSREFCSERSFSLPLWLQLSLFPGTHRILPWIKAVRETRVNQDWVSKNEKNIVNKKKRKPERAKCSPGVV